MDPGPISFTLLHRFTITCIVYFLVYYYCFHSIRSYLCLQQTGEIDNLIVSWEQSTWLCCVQVPRCCWCKAKHWTRRLINSPEQTSPSDVWLFPTGSINLGFLLRENLLLCSSYLPLGIPNWVVICPHQAICP
jgi:hypothetical protein